MRESLLQVLREPGTGAELQIEVGRADGEEILEGSLRSKETGVRYPVRAGIPRFVPAESYCDSFGLQWNRFARAQLDSANGADYSRRRFDAEVGWSSADLEGKWVLDGGCGCGRFAEVAAARGGQIVALDYSSAVDAAARNLDRFANVHFVQGDLLQPPLRRGSMARAYSIGVLQHTPDPGAALRSFLRLVAPGGSFAMTIYGKRWYTRFYSKYLLRAVTRRVRPESLMRSLELLMPVLFPVTDVLFRLPLVGKAAQFAIPVANYVDKTGFTLEQRREETLLDTFDMLAPAYDRPMTAAEVEQAFRDCSVAEYRFRSTVPVVVSGVAPASSESRT